MAILENQRYELFAQALARGLPASEAYVEAGYKRNDGNASTLKGNQKIIGRVAEIQAYKLERAVVDREWVIAKLVDNVERAMQAQQVITGDDEATGEYRYEGSVANRALELLGKEIGMFVDRVRANVTVDDGTEQNAQRFASGIARIASRSGTPGSDKRTVN